MESFWESSGARGPLILEVEGDGDPRAIRHVFDRPFLLIGSGSKSDLVLDHPDVSRRHAFLQVIGGRPFCVDLESRTGTHPGDGTSLGGWLTPDHPIRIGPYRIRAEVVEGTWGPGPSADASPLSLRGVGSDPWPRASLDFEHEGRPTSLPIARTLSLVGRSGRCKIRLTSPEASRFQAALLRTPGGIWAVDLRSTERIAVNGARMEYARLETGDELRVGPLVARVSDDSTALAPGRSGPPAIARQPEPSAGDLRAILEQVVDLHQQSNDQFRQVIGMVTQLFGSMHRESMDLVREELEQVRNLAGEMKALREESAEGRSAGSRAPTTADTGVSTGGGSTRDPGEIHLIVGERLAAFDRERRGRWDQLSRLLGRSLS
jgi:pSer/pThr/pTyr-binding forkhead associated (FHA) protein